MLASAVDAVAQAPVASPAAQVGLLLYQLCIESDSLSDNARHGMYSVTEYCESTF